MNQSSLYKKLYFALQEISAAVVFSDKIEFIANSHLDVALDFTTAEVGSVMLLNDSEDLHILASRGLPQEYVKDYRGKFGEGIAGGVAKSRMPVLIRDIGQHDDYGKLNRSHYKTRSFMSCPLILKHKLIGVINVASKKDGTPFTEDAFDLLQIIASHASVALERASLTEQIKAAAAELEMANKRLIETDLLKTEFLNRLSHELRTPLNSLKGAIYYLRGQDAVSREDRTEFESIIAAEADKMSSLVENLLQFLRVEDESRTIAKTVVHLHTVLDELSSAASLRRSLKTSGISLTVRTDGPSSPIAADKMKTMHFFTNLIEGLAHHLKRDDSILITLREDDFVNVDIRLSRRVPRAVLGHLQSANSIFHSVPSEDRLKLYLARSIADIHRWRLSVENSDNSCMITLAIPKSMRETAEAQLKQGMDAFVDFIAETMDLDICSIMMTDDLTGELTVKSAHGLDEGVVKRTRIKLGDKIAGWVALEGKPLFIENIENDERFSKTSIPQYTTKSLISLPLSIGDRVVGVLNLNNKAAAKPFSQHDYAIASQIGQKISKFIELLRAGDAGEEDFQRFVASLEELLGADPAYQVKKKELLVEFADNLRKNFKPSIKLRSKAAEA
jgi:GAF domain-containing protein